MKRRAVCFIKSMKTVQMASGQMGMTEVELTKVFNLDTTLDQLYQYCREKGAQKTAIIFEDEEPRDA